LRSCCKRVGSLNRFSKQRRIIGARRSAMRVLAGTAFA
jgi:hypothetical protein